MRSCLALLLFVPLPAVAAGFVALDLPGSQLTALADDGRSAAGSLASGASGDSGGFHWQQTSGAHALRYAVSVRAISPSGRYVAGSSLDENANEVATWWDADGNPHRIDALPLPAGPFGSTVQTIGDAGEVRGLVRSRDDRGVAFSWTAPGGLRLLGAAPAAAPPTCRGANAAEASAPSAAALEFTAGSRDGALRVGHAGRGAERRAIVWTPQDGTQRLGVFLAAHGVEVPHDWTLVAATAVDPDARRIGGYGLRRQRFDSFVAELPAHVRILCDSSIPPAASQHPNQEIKP